MLYNNMRVFNLQGYPESLSPVEGAAIWMQYPRGLTVRGYTQFEIVRNPEKLARGKQFIYNGLESGALKPIIDRTFPLENIVEAHRYLESKQQKGKIVVTV